jgi:hypothetical protein
MRCLHIDSSHLELPVRICQDAVQVGERDLIATVLT